MNIRNYIIVLLMLFISAKSNVLVHSYFFTISAFSFSLLIFLYKGLKVDRQFLYFSIIYFFVSFTYYFIFSYVDLLYVFYYFILLLYGYINIKIVKYDFFKIYHDIVYYLSLISIPFFILQLIDLELTFKFVGLIQNNISFLSNNDNYFANNFLFTIDKLGGTLRNSGFAWEPKGFSNFLILAIVFNTVLYNFTINRKIIVFVIALFTTFSTVGYFILCTCFVMYLFINKSLNRIYSIIFLIFAVFVLFIGNDFIIEKIRYEMFDVETQINKVYDKRKFDKRSLGRFGSLIIDYNDFIKHPITGYGIQRRGTDKIQLRTQSKYNYTKLVRVNGFSDRLATFGILGMLFYIFSIYLSFKKYLTYHNYKGQFIILIIFLMIEFATNLLTDPFWMVFLFLHLIQPENSKKHE